MSGNAHDKRTEDERRNYGLYESKENLAQQLQTDTDGRPVISDLGADNQPGKYPCRERSPFECEKDNPQGGDQSRRHQRIGRKQNQSHPIDAGSDGGNGYPCHSRKNAAVLKLSFSHCRFNRK
jgi:hypothetical protein